MNIGFHYFATKALAVLAGFSEPEAQVIAYACQYVDEATEHEPITVHGLPRPTFERMAGDVLDPTCTAHKGIQNILYNFDGVRRKVLLPFHFMPAGWNAAHSKFDYLTRPESPPALALVRLALQKLRTSPPGSAFRELALIRLGVALHTYEDTFAHQGFSARNSRPDNDVDDPRILVNGRARKLPSIFVLTGFFGYAIGHGLIGTFPDRFNTKITYLNGLGKSVYVNNLVRLKNAARQVYQLLREYTEVPDDWDAHWARFQACLAKDSSDRGAVKKMFAQPYPEISFSFNAETWKKQALRPRLDGSFDFAGGTRWLDFHRAAWEQRQYVLSFLPA